MAQHPRDVHVTFNEQQQQQLDGDLIDTRGRKKVVLDVHRVSQDETALTATLSHEDHTLGNILRHTLMQRTEVTAAGYSIPHPLDAKMVLHLQTKDVHAVDALMDSLEEIADLCEKTADRISAVVPAAA